jgi:hypothetical protein
MLCTSRMLGENFSYIMQMTQTTNFVVVRTFCGEKLIWPCYKSRVYKGVVFNLGLAEFPHQLRIPEKTVPVMQ